MVRKRNKYGLTELEKRAWELRVSGKTWSEIASELGVLEDAAEGLVLEAEKKMRGVKQIMTIKTKELLEDEQRRLEALKARLQGKQYEEIARLCGYANAQAAKDAVMEAIRNAPEPVREEIRRIDIARLDELYKVAYSKAVETGDPRAVNACLNIIERRWKLYNIAVDGGRSSSDDLRRRLESLTDDQLIEIVQRGLEALQNNNDSRVSDDGRREEPTN